MLTEHFSLAFLDDLLTAGCKNNFIKGHNVWLGKKKSLIYGVISLPAIGMMPDPSLTNFGFEISTWCF